MTPPAAFRVADQLPRGITVLEASAGTGKTFQIAALAARMLAEGTSQIEELLIVTFSRAATAELSKRVRERLQLSAHALRKAAAGTEPTDELDRLLCQGIDAAERLARADRLAAGFAAFDRATIMTTHEFCESMLRGLGILAPQTPQSTLVDELTWLADEVAADVYLQRYGAVEGAPPFPFADSWRDGADPGARSIARAAVEETAPLIGKDLPGVAGERVRFADLVRTQVAQRKQQLRIYSFNDQLTRLADALTDPTLGPAAQARLSARFPVVLVDEFQDTDPVQWQILTHAFAAESTVVLIGDPKQAIYGFRGGDIQQYTAATQAATVHTTLAVNHRSEPQVVQAVGALFGGVQLGDQVDVPPVTSARSSSLVAQDPVWDAGIQIRTILADEPLPSRQAAEAINQDVVSVTSSLLGPAPPLQPGHGAIRPRDVAILVRSNRRGHALATALSESGVAVTFAGTSSVFNSPAAADWLTLLQAMDHRRRPYLQRAWLTDFIGATISDIAVADDTRTGEWALLVHRWSRALARTGIPGLMRAIETDTDFSARLLQYHGGERLVTDHQHLGELLHAHSLVAGGRARELGAWLGAEIERSQGDVERTRRLETDADAVQIMTVHRAKGLQWPVVLVPEAATAPWERPDTGQGLVVPASSGRTLDVGGSRATGRTDRYAAERLAAGDEELRTLYVALTRAQSHVVTWWAHHRDIGRAPLHRLLFAPRSVPAQRPALSYPPEGQPHGTNPGNLPWLADGSIAVVPVSPDRPPVLPPRTEPGRLAARAWNRTVDPHWRRTSFSGITAGSHAPGVPAEGGLLSDETIVSIDLPPADPALHQPSPMADLPSGAAFGSLVHEVFERVDPSTTLPTALTQAVSRALIRWPVAGTDADALAHALMPSFDTPLGPIGYETRLRDITPADRLTEMDFEFPLANPAARVADLADRLSEHLPAGHPLADYPERLRTPDLAPQHLHGFLTGSIDAVLRITPAPGEDRFLVVDYKTNRLAPTDEPLTLGHYTPTAMAAAMMDSHYPLQALLYSVALHRYLQLRLPDYAPERHLAGIAYLFVRGLAGSATPRVDGTPVGVFTWEPPSELVLTTSALLAQGAP
ncbi:MAG: UvrD-helicase domain-containing protein [Propioniciclava sp.]